MNLKITTILLMLPIISYGFGNNKKITRNVAQANIGSFGKKNCTEAEVKKVNDDAITASVGQPVGGSDEIILKVDKIESLTQEEKGYIYILTTYEQTWGKSASATDISVYNMKGFVKIRKSDCKFVDGMSVGSSL